MKTVRQTTQKRLAQWAAAIEDTCDEAGTYSNYTCYRRSNGDHYTIYYQRTDPDTPTTVYRFRKNGNRFEQMGRHT